MVIRPAGQRHEPLHISAWHKQLLLSLGEEPLSRWSGKNQPMHGPMHSASPMRGRRLAPCRHDMCLTCSQARSVASGWEGGLAIRPLGALTACAFSLLPMSLGDPFSPMWLKLPDPCLRRGMRLIPSRPPLPGTKEGAPRRLLPRLIPRDTFHAMMGRIRSLSQVGDGGHQFTLASTDI